MVTEKKCGACGEVKPFKEFTLDRTKPDGRHGHCRKCVAVYSRKCVLAIREKKAEYVLNLKQNGRCSVCGRQDCETLVFHHTDREDKKAEICKMMHRNKYTFSALKAEIEKCVLACVKPCHGILHPRKGQLV